ncbi:hypothetical protein A8C56_10320 [Niabella ginsenosidivorans]|uniref:Nitrogen fixation protein FixH n=1 Tax=Niabella ginsenosidivorans TaxID=1176587 RepID=A0A1A9I124_9BACT|nr:FixH family protein [Niabella ginsenosidivorans]ANH81326.1 hypothetical protein A8C56_10320 [Niabella ginsenosidivorans]
MSWGYRVLIILGIFLVGMISMVVVATRQTNEMIDSDYYEKELAYQKVIDGRKRLKATGEAVMIKTLNNFVEVQLPSAASGNIRSGAIEFLRLSGSKGDRKLDMGTSAAPVYRLPVSMLMKGWYRVRMHWVNNDSAYYHEQNFRVQ